MNYIKTITLRGARASQLNVKTVRVSSRRIHTDDQHDLGTWELVAYRIFDALQRRNNLKRQRAEDRAEWIRQDNMALEAVAQ